MRAARSLTFSAVLVLAGSHAMILAASDWREDVAAFAHRVVDAGLTPGIGLAVAQGDQVVYAQGFGLADLESRRPVSESTLFYIASTTKSLTAEATLLAAHRGDLDLDAPMTRYLPDAKLAPGVAPDITIRELLTLTHGLDGDGPIVFRTAYSGDYTGAQLPTLLRYHPRTGTRGVFEYQNLGYNLLGMVLEARYGESWKEVVRREVLDPIGMADTTSYLSRVAPDRMARPHRFTPEGFRRVTLGKTDATLHAAGGHFATPRDMARFLAVQLSGGLVEGVRVLPEAPVRLAHQQHVDQDRQFGPFHRFGWGFGWDLGTYEGGTIIHRFGAFPGYRSHVSFMPAHDLGVVVLANGDGAASLAADLIATYVYDRLQNRARLGETYETRFSELAARAEEGRARLAQSLAERAGRNAPLPHPLEAYTGTYESPKLGRMVWRMVEGRLDVTMGIMGSRAEVYDAARNALRVELTGGGQVVEFAFARPGAPATALRYQGEEFRRLTP